MILASETFDKLRPRAVSGSTELAERPVEPQPRRPRLARALKRALPHMSLWF